MTAEPELAEWEKALLGDSIPPWLDAEGACPPCSYFRHPDEGFYSTSTEEEFTDQSLPFVDCDDDEVAESYGSNWLPLMSIEEARECFGGSDFLVEHTNVVRTKKTRWEL